MADATLTGKTLHRDLRRRLSGTSRLTCHSRLAQNTPLYSTAQHMRAPARTRNAATNTPPPRFVRNVMSLGHVSHAFPKCVIAVAKSRFLYASAPSFFSASAAFFAAASSASIASSSASASAILTSDGSSRALDDDGGGGACVVDADGEGEVGGEEAEGIPGGTSSEPSCRLKPCMSMPMSAPRTSIMRGSPLSRLCASCGFCCISLSCKSCVW